jgi:hypothetical protein
MLTSRQRRLYRTRHVNQVKASDIDGVCFVKFIEEADVEAIEAWIKDDSDLERFYTNERQIGSGDLVPMEVEEIEVCQHCEHVYQQEMAAMDRYHLFNDPLSALDLFSGILSP